MSFFDISQADFDLLPIIFGAKEVIEMVCLDFNDTSANALIMTCRVLSGEHAGKSHTLYIDNKETTYARKAKLQFATAFWTKEEILAGDWHPSKLVNRKFSVIAQAPREYEGKTFQNFTGFIDLKEYEGTDIPPTQLNGSAEDHASAPRF